MPQKLGAPRVEQIEPLLPAAAGALADRLVRQGELGPLLFAGPRLGPGEQLGPRRGVALAGLGHAAPDEALERLVLGHLALLSTAGTSRLTLTTPLPERAQLDRRPESWGSLCPLGPVA